MRIGHVGFIPSGNSVRGRRRPTDPAGRRACADRLPDAGVGVNQRRVGNPPQFDFTKSNFPGWVMNSTHSLADRHGDVDSLALLKPIRTRSERRVGRAGIDRVSNPPEITTP
jgi:hypothetical protein